MSEGWKCHMIEQGYKRGDCLVELPAGERELACRATLREEDGAFLRLIKSIHLSRPEHYLSIYQSGCNHACLKCHSWEFSQLYNGTWVSVEALAELVSKYERLVTYWEPRERATTWHATDLCRCCGRCVLQGQRSPLCPGVLDPEQVVLSPQGFGPARNIVAFTGGDIACRADFYAEATRAIKRRCQNMWVLLETNGYGLTPANLDLLVEAGLDAFWLDIKAYHDDVYRELCGTTNEWILKAPAEILKRGFTLEVLTLFIPGWVETDQIKAIARLLAEIDRDVPFIILAFFPTYRLADNPSPTLAQMLEAYAAVKEIGLRQVKLANPSVFARTTEDWDHLLAAVGRESVA